MCLYSFELVEHPNNIDHVHIGVKVQLHKARIVRSPDPMHSNAKKQTQCQNGFADSTRIKADLRRSPTDVQPHTMQVNFKPQEVELARFYNLGLTGHLEGEPPSGAATVEPARSRAGHWPFRALQA